VNLRLPKRAERKSPQPASWIAIACLAIAAIVVLDGRVTVLAQDSGANPPKIAADNGDDFDSGGDSIRVTGGVEGAPATPAAEAETAPSEVPPAPPAAAPKAVAAAPASSPAAAPPRAIAAAPASAPRTAASARPPRPMAAARPAVPASPPTVAAAPAFAPEEPGIPVATAPATSEEPAGGSSGSEEAAGSAPAKSKTEVASATPPSNGFPGSEFGANHGPIDIKSDTMALDYNGKAVMFTGHVRAIQAGGQLTSDKLKVAYGDNFHDVKQMFADGNVRISQGNRWETSDHAVLDQTKHTVVLTGSPVVHQGPDQITGKRITVHLDSGQSVVEGARAVIFPKGSSETAAGQKAPPTDGEAGQEPAPTDSEPGEHLP
jgi:lipopolysaccharide transport protein LptA